MKKVLLIILLLLVVLGIAAGVGVWKVRHLADSKLLIKEETIFTLKPGAHLIFYGCCRECRKFRETQEGLQDRNEDK